MFLARKAVRPIAEATSAAGPAPRLAPVAAPLPDRSIERRAPADDPDDGTLLDRTFKWLATLPADLRPTATARAYPRIVNRIGDLWGHCEYTRLYFQGLLIDRRRDRKGFPPGVRRELEALQQYYFETLSGLPAILWNAVPVNAPRIPHAVFPLPPNKTEIDILPLLRDI
jgi:hypothetical protein